MEVGDQPVHHPEPVARGDHEPGLAGAGPDGAVVPRRRFERADHRRADRPDRGAPPPGFRDRPRRRRWDLVALGMHRVAGEVLHVDRLEGARAHLELEPRDPHPASFEPGEQPGREVQPRRRRRDAPLPLGEDGLIANIVVRRGLAVDVGRQRQAADPRHRLLRGGADDPDSQVSLGEHLQRLHREAVAQLDPLARAERAAGPAHRDPAVTLGRMDQQHLRRRTGGTAADEAGVADPRGVEDEEVVGRNEIYELGEMTVLERRKDARTQGRNGRLTVNHLASLRLCVVASHHQQPALAPPLRRHLRDQLGRERVIEIRGAEPQGGLSHRRARPALLAPAAG